MLLSNNLKNQPLEKIPDFCRRWQVNEFCLFGSVLSDNFDNESDVDVMVQFDSAACPTFSGLDQMELELKELFCREIDLITRKGIEASCNYLRRNEILSFAQVIYAA